MEFVTSKPPVNKDAQSKCKGSDSKELRLNHFVAEDVDGDDKEANGAAQRTVTRRYLKRVRQALRQYDSYIPIT